MIRAAILALPLLSGCTTPMLLAGGTAAGAVGQDIGAFDAAARAVKSLLPAKPQACTAAAPN